MAFDSLSEKLQNVFKKLRSKGALTEKDVQEAMKEDLLPRYQHYSAGLENVPKHRKTSARRSRKNEISSSRAQIQTIGWELIKSLFAESTALKFLKKSY